MRNLLRIILYKPINWAAKKFASRPVPEKVFSALDTLYAEILENPGKRGLLLPFDPIRDCFIIFSDQHKGNRDGADDFAGAELNYLRALDHYSKNDFTYISLGDSEELWENSIWTVKKKNTAVFELEKIFLQKNKFIKIFGNHDLFWDNDPLAAWHLKDIYGEKLRVYEGLILQSSGGAVDSRLLTLPTPDYSSSPTATRAMPNPMATGSANSLSPIYGHRCRPSCGSIPIHPPMMRKRKHCTTGSCMNGPPVKKKSCWSPVTPINRSLASLTHLERLFKQFQEALKQTG